MPRLTDCPNMTIAVYRGRKTYSHLDRIVQFILRYVIFLWDHSVHIKIRNISVTCI